MPSAPSHVDMMTESVLCLSTEMPDARANIGFDPTAVIAVPVFVCRNAQIMNAKSAKKRISPNDISRVPIFRQSRLCSIWE